MNISENDIQKIKDAWKKLTGLIKELADRLQELIGEISEKLGLQTSKRYRFVKKLSKVSGIDQKILWKKTSIYRIRSNC